ncbi:MAG: MraY family glycosyltransferase [Polynucleobacter sp.]
MSSLIAAFIASFLVSILIIRSGKFHAQFSGDSNLSGPQKFHKVSVPRIGGLGIALGLLIGISLHAKTASQSDQEMTLLLCAIPVFSIGLLEDFTKKISIRMRLTLTALGAIFAIFYLGAQITRIDIPGVDFIFLLSPLSIAFSIFAITGLANAYNIIDGFNGLSSMVGMIALLAIGYMGIQFNDSPVVFLSFSMVAAILGFFAWNYPRGLIFLGDGGAYLIGFWIATLSVLIVSRHEMISPWFALMINAYPIWETVFTIYRRKYHQGKSPGHPDGIHFHSLIFRRIFNSKQIRNEDDWFSANAKTSPYLWALSSFAVIPGVLFWNSTPILMGCFFVFAILYVWLYKRIISFKTPQWMRIN